MDRKRTVSETIGFNYFLRLVDDIGHIDLWNTVKDEHIKKGMRRVATYTHDMMCTGFCGKHTKDACTTSDVQYSLPFEQMCIVYDGRTI